VTSDRPILHSYLQTTSITKITVILINVFKDDREEDSKSELNTI